MNILKGEIEKLTISGSLTLIGINVNNIGMSAIVIDTPKTAPYLKVGNTITVVFKETEVIICKGNTVLAFLSPQTKRPMRCPKFLLEKFS